jgi:hypothetical protein
MQREMSATHPVVTPEKGKLLVIDDEADIREGL